MRKQSFTAIAMALVIGGTSATAWAQPGHGGPQGHAPQHRPAPPSSQPHKHPAPPPVQAHPHAQPPKMHPHGMPPGQVKRMGAGPQHNWVKGGRVPPQYRTQHYVVNDWRGHGLKRPPRGYQWVQNGGDYLLVAIATGVISQLILGY